MRFEESQYKRYRSIIFEIDRQKSIFSFNLFHYSNRLSLKKKEERRRRRNHQRKILQNSIIDQMIVSVFIKNLPCHANLSENIRYEKTKLTTKNDVFFFSSSSNDIDFYIQFQVLLNSTTPDGRLDIQDIIVWSLIIRI